MDDQTEVSSVRISRWMCGGNYQIRAEWTGQAIPGELVHDLLGWIDTPAGGSNGWVVGFPPISVDVRITVRDEEIPF
jgi:hypothetical protein